MQAIVGVASAILIASGANALPAPVPVEEATGKALMQCVSHTTRHGSVEAKNSDLLAANGLIYSSEPPAFLVSTKTSFYGNASYATVPSTEGQVWAVGYDGAGDACAVFVLGSAVEPIESRLLKLFSIPGFWVPVKAAPASPGEKKLEYMWDLGRPGEQLTALISIRDMSNLPAKGFILVTITRTEKKK